MIYYFFILSLLSWPFGQLLTFQFQHVPLSVYFLDIAIALTALSILLSQKYRKLIILDPLFKPLSIFLFIATLSLFINIGSQTETNILIAFSYLIRLYIYPAAYFAVKYIPFKRLRMPLLLSATLFCLLSLAQYILMPDMTFLGLIGFDNHYYRLIGSFFDPNFTGAVLAGLSLFFITIQSYPASLLVIIMLALTFSRASYASFSLGIMYILIKQKKVIYLEILVLLAMIVYLIPKPFGEGVNLGRTFSILSRLDSWKNGLDLFVQRPFFGWGYNTLRSITGSRFQIDNSYLQIAATMGIFGLGSFFNFLYVSHKLIKRLPEKAFLLAILVHGLFNNSLFYIWIFFACFVILGLGTKEYRQS